MSGEAIYQGIPLLSPVKERSKAIVKNSHLADVLFNAIFLLNNVCKLIHIYNLNSCVSLQIDKLNRPNAD